MGIAKGVLVVIPALNEELSIANVIAEVLAVPADLDCLVVSDGSTDNTVEIARDAGAKVINLPVNLGVGGAMRAGFRYAKRNYYTTVVQVDADGQHDPIYIPQLLDALERADLVIGARFAGKGIYDVSGPRKWAMATFAALLSKTTGAHLTDTTSGFRAIGPKALDLFAREYPAEYLGDTIEALVMASRAGCVITQVPVEMRKRQTGTASHNPIKSAIYLGRASLALLVAYMRPRMTARRTNE